MAVLTIGTFQMHWNQSPCDSIPRFKYKWKKIQGKIKNKNMTESKASQLQLRKEDQTSKAILNCTVLHHTRKSINLLPKGDAQNCVA